MGKRKMPERIWAGIWPSHLREWWHTESQGCSCRAEYIRADLAAERERALVDSAKAIASDLLAGALNGSDPSVRTGDGHVRWGLVEKRIHSEIDAILLASIDSPAKPG